ncbi:MAG: 4Fe-4S binding protein [Mogibacterium sp.]|nr:4Fe-4S binding protein [Mogibacterium sp.]
MRKAVQAGWGIISNAYIKGFLPGDPVIYQGKLKQVCVPGMNCYSCPGALGSCPIGSMQAIFDNRHRGIGAYVIGYLAIIGLFIGRFICAWLCLFGLIQELLYKIPTPKLTVPEKIDRPLRYLKYVMLFVMVFLLPFFYRSKYGVGEPFFCKYICPVGTLEGGIPLVLLNSIMRGALGWLFRWKFLLLILCIAASIFIYRPFCKYICPLGAFYGLFQKVSLIRMRVDKEKCVDCGICAKTCKMNVDPHKTPNSNECIRCREYIHACPMHALSMNIGPGPVQLPEQEVRPAEEA